MSLSVIFGALWRALAGLLVLALIGLAGLVVADQTRRPDAIAAAIAQGFAEGRLGGADGFDRIWGRELSHFSECIGLSTALNREAYAPVWFAIASPALQWAPPSPMCRTLQDEVEGHSSSRYYPYARYWHGYRLLTEPILSYFSYAALQGACAALLGLAAVALFAAAGRAVGFALAALALLLPALATESLWLWLTPTHAISFASLMLGAALLMRQARGREGGAPALAASAFLAGAVYNFFDFLYNPDLLVFLAGWAGLMAAARDGSPLGPRLRQAVLAQGAALAGYIAMWALKWLLVYASGRYGFMPWFPSGDINRWLAGGEHGFVPLAATLAVLGYSVDTLPSALAMAACGLGLTAAATLALRQGKGFCLLALGALWLAPIAMLEAKAGHTIMHAPFVGRFVPWAAAFTLAGALFIVRQPSLRPRSA